MKQLLSITLFNLLIFNSFGQNCSVVQESGGLNTGFACDYSGSYQVAIDDFIVPQGESWGINTVKMNLITNADPIANPEDFDIYFFMADGGDPVFVDGSYITGGNYTATYIATGDLGIGDTYQFTFDMDHMILLPSLSPGTNYWIGITSSNGNASNRYYWEVDTVSAGNYGLNCAVSNDWNTWYSANADFVFEFDYFMYDIQNETHCGSYTWTNGDGNTYTSSTSVDYTVPGGAVNGCDSIVTLNLTINPLGTSTDLRTSCEPFTWIDGNTYSTSNNTAEYVIPNGSWTGCDSVVTLNLTVFDIQASATDNGDGTLTASGASNVQWIDCSNNAPIVGATFPTFAPTENGNYAAIVSNGSCSDTSACVEIDYLGITGNKQVSFSIFPNPAKENATVLYAGIPAQLIVYDQRGTIVLTTSITGNATVDMKNFANGVYTLEVNTGNVSSKQRLVKL